MTAAAAAVEEQKAAPNYAHRAKKALAACESGAQDRKKADKEKLQQERVNEALNKLLRLVENLPFFPRPAAADRRKCEEDTIVGEYGWDLASPECAEIKGKVKSFLQRARLKLDEEDEEKIRADKAAYKGELSLKEVQESAKYQSLLESMSRVSA